MASISIGIIMGIKKCVELGTVLITSRAMLSLSEEEQEEFLERHRKGDWGDLNSSDKKRNTWAVVHKDRVVSTYKPESGDKILIITEADRSATTILLSEEY